MISHSHADRSSIRRADALGLLGGANGCRSANSGQVIASISVVALSFIVHEPSGIMPRSSAKSRSASRRR